MEKRNAWYSEVKMTPPRRYQGHRLLTLPLLAQGSKAAYLGDQTVLLIGNTYWLCSSFTGFGALYPPLPSPQNLWNKYSCPEQFFIFNPRESLLLRESSELPGAPQNTCLSLSCCRRLVVEVAGGSVQIHHDPTRLSQPVPAMGGVWPTLRCKALGFLLMALTS